MRNVHIRDLRPSDKTDWRRLWTGYLDFYETDLPRKITDRTWQSLLDSDISMSARIAEEDGHAIGFSVCVLHPGSWAAGAVCYLEDLFVDPRCRGRGTGRALIQDIIDQGRAGGWATLYWHTRRDNPARKLYDEFVAADEFVRYRLPLK